MVLQIARITKDRPDLFHLLEEAYEDIYVPAFPDKDERESLKTFQKAVNGKYENVEVVINILGENLEDPDNYVVKGIGIAYYFEKQNVGLLAYNAIAPEHRERGMGKLMVQSRIASLKDIARKAGKELAGVFIECNDPAKVAPEDDSMDPAKRVALFEKWGARRVPIDYVQPPVSKHDDYSENLLLLNYPVNGKYAGKDVIEGFLRACYRDGITEKVAGADGQEKTRVVKADDDYFFKQMKQQLDKMDMKDIPAPPVLGYKTGAPKFRFFNKP